MRIVEIRERSAPVASAIANSFIDFSKMTVSVVAVVTDVIRDGKRVVGYGFTSNGRYSQSGLLQERFIPRLLEAKPESLRDDQPLTDLGLDSLMGVEIENLLESSIGVALPPTSLMQIGRAHV